MRRHYAKDHPGTRGGSGPGAATCSDRGAHTHATTFPQTSDSWSILFFNSGEVVSTQYTFTRCARRSAIGSLLLGMAGQAGYHLLAQAQVTHAPWPVTTLVSL